MVRIDKVDAYNEKLSTLRDKERFLQQREERTQELRNIEGNDPFDTTNIISRNIALTNKLADQILEQKIHCLLANYGDTQNAFHKIKNKTVFICLI